MFARLLAQVLALVFPPRADERIVRTASADTLLALLNPELVPLGGYSAATLLPFTDERVRAAIHEAKYHGTERAFTLLAGVLAEYLRELINDRYDRAEYVLVPVPLGAKRRAERGYNQVEEVLKRVPHELKLPVAPDLLTRTRETESQVSLPRRQRLTNMKGAFTLSLSKGLLDPGTIYIVVDDVLTTGATLSAACAALQAAGAEQIMAVALAH